MARIERIGEILTGPISPEYLRQRTERGWKPVTLEWERELETEGQGFDELKEDVPFGLKVADDCLHPDEDWAEKQILLLMMELIVQDRPSSQVAEEMNRQGDRTREGLKWVQSQSLICFRA